MGIGDEINLSPKSLRGHQLGIGFFPVTIAAVSFMEPSGIWNKPAVIRAIRQIVIVNDGGTRGYSSVFADMAYACQAQDVTLTVIETPKRLGAPAAKNAGLSECTCDEILTTDDDIELPDDMVAKCRADRPAADGPVLVGPRVIYLRDGETHTAALERARHETQPFFDMKKLILCAWAHPGAVKEYPFVTAVALWPAELFRQGLMVARMLERRTQGKMGAIANSTWLRDVLQAQSIPVRNCVVPPPTDCERFTPGDKRAARAEFGLPDDKRLILFAGRWEYAKGADRCVQIFEGMPEDWHLLIVTPSGFTWPMVRGDNFTVVTDLDTDRMISAYRAADALVQPSRFEGYSLVASEAQACGLPVLTSRVGQAAHFEQSDHPCVRASVIQNADDAQEWISKLTAIFSNDETQNCHSRAHRSYAEENVSFPTVQRAWQRVLSEIFEDFSWQPR